MITQTQLVSDYHKKQVSEGDKGQADIIDNNLKCTVYIKSENLIKTESYIKEKSILQYKLKKRNVLQY